MSPRLLLIDGHSMAYRAFYALPVENFTTATGQHTNAIYGFATMLISLIREQKPTHIAVAFDVSRKTFRSEIFPEYKANRSATPDEFRSQMSYLKDLVTAFEISSFSLEGYEADDILATLATRAEAEGMEVLICSGDRDTFQLVRENITVLYPKKGVSDLALMTPEAVLAKYGMSPSAYPDFAALRGDPSDNLPSIPGVGDKTAAKWVVEYGSIENIFAHQDSISGKVGESLRSNIEIVKRNRELTQLLRDVPISFDLPALAWSGLAEEKIQPLFDLLEFRQLKDRIKPLLRKKPEAPALSEDLFTLFSVAPAVEFTTISKSEADKKVAAHSGAIAISFEVVEEKLLRYGLAFSQSERYLVASHEMGSWISDPAIPKILHGAKSLARIIEMEGLIFDTELAAYLVNPGLRGLSLSNLLERWGDGTTLGDANSESYLVESAAALFLLQGALSQEMAERELTGLYEKLELPVAQLLATMERRGIAVDQVKLLELHGFFAAEAELQTRAAHDCVGHEFNVASPKQLQVVLFDELNLPKTKKIKTGYTTDADSLDWLAQQSGHPLLAHLLRIREVNKLKTTIESLLAEVAHDGRIRTHFQQTVAATGRLSSTGPNLQNIPVRTEEGRKIRDCFIAGKNFSTLLTADYSQIEMRIMAHLSNDAHLLAAFEKGEDLHSTVAAEVFGVEPTAVDGDMRRQIKAMSYGLAYGLSSYGLSAQLEITPPAAQALMDRYFERFGGIRDYLKTVVEEARKVGYTETILGRRRYLPDLNSDNRQRRDVAERMALNAPIQGSAADIIKEAMLRVERAIVQEGLCSELLLQVHDELIFEVSPGEEDLLGELVRREMAAAYPLKARLEVSVGIGVSWNKAAH